MWAPASPGAKDRRPELDKVMALARAVDAVLVAGFDRFGRSLPHLVGALEEFRHLGVLADLPRPLADDQPYFSITPRALQRLWGRAVQAAGIPDLHLHDLRHVVGSHLLNKGVPDQMRAEVLGHSAGRQFATTAGYSHATLEYLRKFYEELDDLAPELWKRSKAAKGDLGAGA